MPELPDLQVYSTNLKKKLCSKKVSSVNLFHPANCNMEENKIKAILAENEIRDVFRNGKEMYFRLNNENTFSVHLMLHGKFVICPTGELDKIRHLILSLNFTDGTSLAITDFQKICKITFNPPLNTVPDALSPDFTYAYFERTALTNARKNVKAFLIDQSIVRGIGNAYADEILWKANISPESIIGKIPKESLLSMYEAIRLTLENAIENILKIAPAIIAGEERSFLNVHRKAFTDDGQSVICKRIAGKSTYYTEKQELFK